MRAVQPVSENLPLDDCGRELNVQFTSEHIFDGRREHADTLVGMDIKILALEDQDAQS